MAPEPNLLSEIQPQTSMFSFSKPCGEMVIGSGSGCLKEKDGVDNGGVTKVTRKRKNREAKKDGEVDEPKARYKDSEEKTLIIPTTEQMNGKSASNSNKINVKKSEHVPTKGSSREKVTFAKQWEVKDNRGFKEGRERNKDQDIDVPIECRGKLMKEKSASNSSKWTNGGISESALREARARRRLIYLLTVRKSDRTKDGVSITNRECLKSEALQGCVSSESKTSKKEKIEEAVEGGVSHELKTPKKRKSEDEAVEEGSVVSEMKTLKKDKSVITTGVPALVKPCNAFETELHGKLKKPKKQ